MLPAAWLGSWGCLILAALFTVAGLLAVSRLPEADEDPGWVVVDEAAGQCLALSCVPAGAAWPWVLAAFLAFRALDILKPGPVGWADRRGGALGVMLDDVIAGALAGAALLAVRAADWG